MTIVAFEKEVSLKALASLAKRLYESTDKKKHLISINGKKKFKRILAEGEKFKLQKLPSKDSIALFSSRQRACPVLKHKFLKGVRYMILSITVKEITF